MIALCLFVTAALILATDAFTFRCANVIRHNGVSLAMKVTEPSVGNLSRKLKRKLRSVDQATFSQIYTPEFEGNKPR